ncbi:secreted protein [methanotrophic bacterial endosymbiont of Bathymodiolus sp.]|nr:secreted protein [methanotrophic bacterial endosymbiont of Bathymodiolus sp.]
MPYRLYNKAFCLSFLAIVSFNGNTDGINRKKQTSRTMVWKYQKLGT